jgi:hypothetical protein
MQAHGFRRTRLQCTVTRTRALHARVTTFSDASGARFPAIVFLPFFAAVVASHIPG